MTKKAVTTIWASLLLAALAGVSLTAAAASSTATARWHLLPKRVAPRGAVLLPLGSAAGRVWFFTQSGATEQNFKLASARVGRRLTSFATSGLRATGISNRIVLGSSILVYPPNAATRIARLHPNGTIGASSPLAGDPEARAQALFKKDLT